MEEQKENEDLVVCKFYNDGRCRFGENCRNVHVGDVRVTNESKNVKKKKKPVKTERNPKEPDVSNKLPPMKTARDVIQRIQWDTDFPSEHFTIGYLDRFLGVIEQPFDLFDWSSDLACVDSNVLAIPQHRIQFFKYRGQRVWDKNNRLDLIFGSTSSTCTDVPTLLRSIDEKLLYKEDMISEETDGGADFSDAEPTHFLAIRVDDVELVHALESVVQELLGSVTCYGKMDSSLFHCTLALLCLDSIEKIAHCTQLLKSIRPNFFVDPPYTLELQGLSTFHNRVLFSRVCDSAKLSAMVTSLIDFLKQNSVQVLERPKEFHVSLVKGWKNVGKLEKDRFKDFDEEMFGRQAVQYVHLCALREGPDNDGFYKVLTSVEL